MPTFPTWSDVEAHLEQVASPATRRLVELTAAYGETETEIRLDPEARVIWWAYDTTELGAEGWVVEQLAPEEATRQADPVADMAEERLEGDYEDGGGRERDEDLLDEYAEILTLTLPAEPREARAQIARNREVAARASARWQRADGLLVTDLAGTERGGRSRASRTLGISPTQVGRIIDGAAARRGDYQRTKRAKAPTHPSGQQAEAEGIAAALGWVVATDDNAG